MMVPNLALDLYIGIFFGYRLHWFTNNNRATTFFSCCTSAAALAAIVAVAATTRSIFEGLSAHFGHFALHLVAHVLSSSNGFALGFVSGHLVSPHTDGMMRIYHERTSNIGMDMGFCTGFVINCM
jgi:hypothetical protein